MAYRYRFLTPFNSHGGTGFGTTHSPRFADLASSSACASRLSDGAYFRYQQQRVSFDQLVVEVATIGQDHPADGAVLAVRPVVRPFWREEKAIE